MSGGSARKSCLPGSYSQEEPWKAVGRNSLKEGLRCASLDQGQWVIVRGEGRPEVSKVYVAQIPSGSAVSRDQSPGRKSVR